MKIKQLYVCELCHTEYNTKEKAAFCEKSHKPIQAVKEERYVSIKDNAKGFPIRVVLTTKDGSAAIYRYEGDAKS